MITGTGSSDNIPYYYPNQDEFGLAVFNTKNIEKDKVEKVSVKYSDLNLDIAKRIGCEDQFFIRIAGKFRNWC